MRKSKRHQVIGGFLVALGICYLIYASIQGSTVYYLTVDEFLAQQDSLTNESVRIAGTVANGTIRRNQNALEMTFAIQGGSKNILLPVYYKGMIPDIFRDGASVVLEGKYNREKGIFDAVTLMTSCPSKYESKLNKLSQ